MAAYRWVPPSADAKFLRATRRAADDGVPIHERAGHASGHDDVTSNPGKGALCIRTSDDQLTHLVWRDGSGQDQLDLIVFPGDAALRHVPQCTDGFVVLLEFSQTGRREFFWSQEPRKKGSDWASEPTTRAPAKGLVDQANGLLGAPTAPAAAPAAKASAASRPTTSSRCSRRRRREGGAAAGGAAAQRPPPPRPRPRRPRRLTGPISAASISSILANIGAAAPQTPPLSLNAVLQPDATAAAVDEAAAARLAEHLPAAGASGEAETTSRTLSSPQLAQAAAQFTEALNSGGAAGLIAELGISPSGPGVEAFLEALQKKADEDAAKEDKMDES